MNIIRGTASIVRPILLIMLILWIIIQIDYDRFSYGNSCHAEENCAQYQIYFFQKQMKKLFGCRKGDGSFITTSYKQDQPYKITKMQFLFHKEGNYNIEESRKMFLEAANLFCNELNENEIAMQYFLSNKFTLNDLELILHFIPDKKHPSDGSIEIVTNAEGKILYKRYDDESSGFKSQYDETYDEAIYTYLKNKNGNKIL